MQQSVSAHKAGFFDRRRSRCKDTYRRARGTSDAKRPTAFLDLVNDNFLLHPDSHRNIDTASIAQDVSEYPRIDAVSQNVSCPCS